MKNQWFLKELVSKPAFDRHGKQIPFEVFGGDYGGIVVDTELNPELAEDLAKMAGSQGILRSSEADFSKKKQLPLHNPHGDPRAAVRVFNPPKQSPAAAAAAVNTPLPPLSPAPVATSDVAPGTGPVVPVVGADPMSKPQGFKPRMGKPKKAA